MSDTIPIAQLRAFVERVERVEEEISTLNADKSEIYKEARGCGFDVKAIRKVVSQRKLDPAERDERDAIFDLYWSALHGTGTGDATRVHVHEDRSYAEEKGRGEAGIPTTEPVNGSPHHLVPTLGDDAAMASSQQEGATGRQPVDTLRAGRERPGEGVTAGETAPNSNSQAASSQPADMADSAPPPPLSAAPSDPYDPGPIPAFLDRRQKTARVREDA